MIVGFNEIFVITNEREYLSFKILWDVVVKQFDITTTDNIDIFRQDLIRGLEPKFLAITSLTCCYLVVKH